jgi:hypothetical protein
MALPLESQIMAKVGLSMHYDWFNGSDCRSTRDAVCKLLPSAIQNAVNSGEKIAPPNSDLINLLPEISAIEDRESITSTWEATSYIIRAHIEAAHNPSITEQFFTNMQAFLINTYLPKPKSENNIYYSEFHRTHRHRF